MIFFNLNTGIASGFNLGGRIYKTTNGGLDWNVKIMPIQIDGITFFNSNTGIAIGITEAAGRCNIYRTTNAGGNWDSLTSVQGGRFIENLKSLPSTGTALAVGSTPIPSKITTLKTLNYGTAWVVKEFLPEKLMTGIALIDQNNFFISGGDMNTNAVILKSTNGGNVFVNQTVNEIPEKFELGHNYPNPFNSVTSIKFKVASVGQSSRTVSLKVFDLQGREVKTLVNEELQAGVYQVRFDAGNLASGVYFYQLKSGVFTETKKMLLTR